MSTLDELTYTNVELRSVPMGFGAEYLERLLKLGQTCRAINARAFRIHLRKSGRLLEHWCDVGRKIERLNTK
ncbi:hypothetical protein MTR_4g054890 [Medicago truncatula]|uniref:Uncharacterized protein n=1 Tax=Medicago truncatula TaxID=3880 RepID=G7JKV7_MEDTR|nr:hypothetical protein MTR_4g054890 [Medicago truncatula]